ncbi:(2Fe-2S) ferredoxin domain-containing protein [Deinococcus sp.]|uniref:(2Fe-2S) ferredoxin domain-containing protein n=1 Tax=Deinococcus sp. TaxID=47478 RepID=UPI003CC652D9
MSAARPPYFRTSGHLLVCQHLNCRSRGSELLYKALWNALERERLAYFKTGGSLRLTESGCLGACSYGPVLCVYRQRAGVLEEGWYAAADLPLALEVARAVHAGEDLPQDRKYGP